MSQPIWTPAQTVREVEHWGIVFHLIYEGGRLTDVVVDHFDEKRATAYWRGLGKIIKHTPAERDGDAERDAQLDMEGA